MHCFIDPGLNDHFFDIEQMKAFDASVHPDTRDAVAHYQEELPTEPIYIYE